MEPSAEGLSPEPRPERAPPAREPTSAAASPVVGGRGVGGVMAGGGVGGGGNPYFSAGFGLMVVGAALAVLRTASTRAATELRRRMLASVEVTSKDAGYKWLLQWIRRHSGDARHLSLETSFRSFDSGRVETRFAFVPAVGAHYVRYRGCLLYVQRMREKEVVDLSSGAPWETVTLTTRAPNRALFPALLEEARRDAQSQDSGKTLIYTALMTEWRPFGSPRRRRPLQSVFLAPGVAERLLADVRDFERSARWYLERGIPYRRGYLLHGPPGCGKTSFITALAGELEYNVCLLNLHDKGLTDDRLQHLMAVLPPHSLVLLEDVDAAFGAAGGAAGAAAGGGDGARYGSPVTFSGVLNMLDGAASTERRLIFMTTNHVHRLDAALLRPGRVDVVERVGLATRQQAENMYVKFYGAERRERARSFAARLLDGGGGGGGGSAGDESVASMAQLQAYLMMHRNSPTSALDDAELFRGSLTRAQTVAHASLSASHAPTSQ